MAVAVASDGDVVMWCDIACLPEVLEFAARLPRHSLVAPNNARPKDIHIHRRVCSCT